jgi:hypothetical protein
MVYINTTVPVGGVDFIVTTQSESGVMAAAEMNDALTSLYAFADEDGLVAVSSGVNAETISAALREFDEATGGTEDEQAAVEGSE